ncbi:NADPH:quinone reductase [Geothermobacter hydrogeniphilus]|uniref:NADPH:quinone reductase n=1 Tax=Geothermobacter hydrogeniphilus TaxID=1969733 RepID=A0A2K2HDD9_9BACT|nr:NADPH:quinone reductase [Geothermobacter hydrogeniphilus]PNU21306.1 NADPH:quinone reductase [Geothermobacter hydrogeniphilus]
MRAVLVNSFGEPETMRIGEVETRQPQAGEILVKIAAAGVNPVDTYIRAGGYPVLPQPPYVPGFDAAGIIESVGDDVKGWEPGSRVWLSGSLTGTYAEFTLCRPDQLHPLPDAVSFAQGAAVAIPAGAAWRALFIRGGARPAEKVLIHGASGAAGLAAVQLAKAAGLRVYGTAGSPEGEDLVRQAGAAAVFNHHAEGYADRLAETTGGVDLIIEMLANVNLERDLLLLAPRGRVVIVGSRGHIEIDPRLTMGKETEIRGMSLFAASEEEHHRTHAALDAALESGVLMPRVSRELPLDQAARAHHEVLETHTLGKIVLIP